MITLLKYLMLRDQVPPCEEQVASIRWMYILGLALASLKRSFKALKAEMKHVNRLEKPTEM